MYVYTCLHCADYFVSDIPLEDDARKLCTEYEKELDNK